MVCFENLTLFVLVYSCIYILFFSISHLLILFGESEGKVIYIKKTKSTLDYSSPLKTVPYLHSVLIIKP